MKCPICNRSTVPDYRPFCSRRCADVDLGRWLTERYSIPAESPDTPEDEGPDSTPPPTPPRTH